MATSRSLHASTATRTITACPAHPPISCRRTSAREYSGGNPLHHRGTARHRLDESQAGIWLFLASEVMLFGSLFSSYALLRSGATSWPDQSAVLSVPLATLNTIILISSSITMVLAWASLKVHNVV